MYICQEPLQKFLFYSDKLLIYFNIYKTDVEEFKTNLEKV